MIKLITCLPVRRSELVSCQLRESGQFLVRNRKTGESFQLGEQEHFLLESLDGRRTPEEICQIFTERFHEPMSEEDLNDFVQISKQGGLIQDVDSQTNGSAVDPGSLEQTYGTPASSAARPTRWKRIKIRMCIGCATVLAWSAWLPNVVMGWMHQRVRQLEFTPRPDDVFIVTYPRSGTTWMQMILYQLTSDGKMDIPHIAEYCPWYERSVRSARGFELRPSPRLFKSHLPYKKIPKGTCKYIYVARNGKDVAVSYYHLERMYNGYDGTVAEFFELFLKGKTSFGSWFKHVKGWWEHRDDPNVLFLTYEELSRDVQRCIRRIAAFVGQELPPQRLAKVTDVCSFAFMKQHETRFDPALEMLWEQGIQLKSFLRAGRVGDGTDSLSEQQRARFENAYAKRLGNLQLPFGSTRTH